ncbi:MAG TPA: ABC transporter ATP-binding protein [Candidatus Limnocylindrales bacterium]|nr:ABC transporter ATP-binding protein [Candidatus Limnocylindrales bacterium]
MTATESPPIPSPSRPGPVIRMESVHKTFGSGDLAVHALRGADLAIDPGQFVVVLGPSGSGKTTLINLIGGIEPATSGRIVVHEVDVTALEERGLTDYRRAQVGFVFQFFNLIPTLTARENVSLVGELVGADGAAAARTLEQVGLGDKADRFPSSLSGGEQQRVAIARALVKRPTVLLLDEPTGSLDLETGRQVLGVLHSAARSFGSTVLLVTHNSAIARMADRVVHLHSGRVVEDRLQPVPLDASELQW